MATKETTFSDRLVALAVRSVIGGLMLLPYRWRVPLMGRITAHVVAPLAGWRKRVRDNLAHVCPELPAEEVERMTRAVPDNAGRSLMELFSGEAFKAHVRDTPLSGPGVAALKQAHEQGRPVILVTAHFGNYDAPRTVLFAQGQPLAALYRPMRNEGFNLRYIEAMSRIGTPVFPTTRKGVLGFVNHLKAGQKVGLLVDVYAWGGAPVTFFGKTAPTATSAAAWALKYDALLVPIYGLRKPNGLDFDVVVEEPITHTDPVAMTQALNDNLESMVRRHMDQWFWIHRRWKPHIRQASAAESDA